MADANPDSALRQALVAAEKAIRPFKYATQRGAADRVLLRFIEDGIVMSELTWGDVIACREAHALITEALKEKP